MEFIRPAIYSTIAVTCIFLSTGIILSQKILKLHQFFRYLGMYLLSASFLSLVYAFVYLPTFREYIREVLIVRRLVGLITGYLLIRMILSIKNDSTVRRIATVIYGILALLFLVGVIDLVGDFQWLFRDPPPLIHIGPLYKLIYIPFSILSLTWACYFVLRAVKVLSPENRRLVRLLLFGLVFMLPFQIMDFVHLLIKKDPFNETVFLFNPAILILFIFIYVFIIEYVRIQSRYTGRRGKVKSGEVMTGFHDDDHEKYEHIVSAITDEKLYINPELTIEDIATRFGETQNTISRLINSQAGVNFKTLINQYRVNLMKEYLDDPSCTLSILELSKKCGFNSKTSLNRIFHLYENMTPREYRNMRSH